MACSVMFMEEFFHALKLSLWAGGKLKGCVGDTIFNYLHKALIAYERL